MWPAVSRAHRDLAANGGRIPNQGEMVLDFVAKQRHRGHNPAKAGYEWCLNPGAQAIPTLGQDTIVNYISRLYVNDQYRVTI